MSIEYRRGRALELRLTAVTALFLRGFYARIVELNILFGGEKQIRYTAEFIAVEIASDRLVRVLRVRVYALERLGYRRFARVCGGRIRRLLRRGIGARRLGISSARG